LSIASTNGCDPSHRIEGKPLQSVTKGTSTWALPTKEKTAEQVAPSIRTWSRVSDALASKPGCARHPQLTGSPACCGREHDLGAHFERLLKAPAKGANSKPCWRSIRACLVQRLKEEGDAQRFGDWRAFCSISLLSEAASSTIGRLCGTRQQPVAGLLK